LTTPTLDVVRSFLAGTGTDDRGRTVQQILQQDDRWLEYTHDFIQWLFPIDAPSSVNPSAPVVAPAAAKELGAEEKIVDNLCAAFVRMAAFYGFAVKDDCIEKAANYSSRARLWAVKPTHNDLRITRILRSLTLFGLIAEAQRFHDVALAAVREYRGETAVQRYWAAALRV